jgi:electron transport complex protein RnfB
VIENVSGTATGWQAWSTLEAALARDRYAQRQQRLQRSEAEHHERQAAKAKEKLDHLSVMTHTHPQDAAAIDRKRAIIEAALARARARQEEPKG